MLVCLCGSGASLEIASLLIDHGINVNMVNSSKDSALSFACNFRHVPEEFALKLIHAGATPTEFFRPRSSDLMYAITRGKRQVAKLLVDMGVAITNELHAAVAFGLTNIVNTMISTGALPQLHAFYHHIDCAKIPPIFRKIPLSPLFMALLFKRTELVEKFLCINFIDNFDMTLSHDMKTSLIDHLDTSGNTECVSLAQRVYLQPWSLLLLCFVKVSSCVGLNSDRRQKLTKTGLPNRLQKQLMFTT